VSSSFRILKLVIMVKIGFDSHVHTFHIFKDFFNIVIDMEFYNWRLKLRIIKVSVVQLIKINQLALKVQPTCQLS
jgi:hypothetical protein